MIKTIRGASISCNDSDQIHHESVQQMARYSSQRFSSSAIDHSWLSIPTSPNRLTITAHLGHAVGEDPG